MCIVQNWVSNSCCCSSYCFVDVVLVLLHVVAVDPRNLPLKFCQNWISNSSDIEDVEFPVVVVVGGWWLVDVVV